MRRISSDRIERKTTHVKKTFVLAWLMSSMLLGASSIAMAGIDSLLLSPQEEDKIGADGFAEIKSKSTLSTDPKMNAMLQRVGKKIAAAANEPDYQWEFILIEDAATANAFCLPGGRVGFFTGILPITKDEAGMATVMSHEVAHAIKHHSANRIKRDRAAGFLKKAAISKGYLKSAEQSLAAEVAYKYGVGMPFNRGQEADADEVGLTLMAKAGYDPKHALTFWERMQAAGGGGKKMSIFSTHPSDAARIQKIKELLPQALTHYRPAKASAR
jgi:metalloendopeptidase OMA1, mitochondrial